MKVVVLGAGVIGVTTAYWLHKAGHEVTVIERRPGAADETSFANGGIIHVGKVGPWSKPGMPLKLLRWLGKEDAPFLLRPSALPRVWRWGLGFIANCRPAPWQASSLRNLELALSSLAALKTIRAEAGLEYDLQEGGLLEIAPTQADLDHAAAQARALAAHGLAIEILDADEARAQEPALRGMVGPLAGAVRYPEDETGDCHLFTRGLAAWLAGRGVGFRYGVTARTLLLAGGKVAGVVTDQGEERAERVVVALGSFSAPFLRPYGLSLPIYPVKGVSLTLPRAAWPEAPRRGILDESRGLGIVPMGERLRLAGTAEIAGYDTTPSERRCMALLDRVASGFPAIRQCYDPKTAKLWAGLRPMTPNGVPLIGPTTVPGLHVNAGHGHLGWTLAAGSGRLAAALLDGRNDPSVHGSFALAA